MRLLAALSLWFALAGFGGHRCGEGPFLVQIQGDRTCACPCARPYVHVRGETYTLATAEECRTQECDCPPVTQRWTNWPECGGVPVAAQPTPDRTPRPRPTPLCDLASECPAFVAGDQALKARICASPRP